MTTRRAPARPDHALPRIALLALLAVAVPFPAQAQPGEPAVPPAVGFVNDRAAVLDEPSRARLEAFLDQLERKTGAEFAVLIVRSTEPEAPEEYKVRVFQSWGLGRKGHDDGLLMLVAIDQRVVRFETGYGLEGTLPDGLQSRIFRDEMRPRFREGDYAAGITAGVLAAAARIAAEKGVTLEWSGRELRYTGGGRGRTLPFWAVLLIFLALVAIVGSINPPRPPGGGKRRRGGWLVGPAGWGGGSIGGWGGGFGGSGGGGSFGGFGGGASGGGGGGGSW